LVLLGGTASAQNVDVDAAIARAQASSPTLESVARGITRRARRAIAVGPTVGLWAGRAPSPGVNEEAVTFGIGLEAFKVPVFPSTDSLKDLVVERAKEKLKQRAVGGEDVDQLARDAWEEAVKEVLAMRDLEPHTFEPPALSLALEVNRTFESDAWLPRLRVGIGVWKLTIAASTAVALGTDAPKTPVYTGLELVGHAIVSPDPRASVVDIFVRGDFELRNRDTNTDMIVVGARFLLDLI